MQRDTDPKEKKLLGAAASAVVVALLALALAGLCLAFVFGGLDGGEDALGRGILLVYALILLAVAAGVFAALRQRWREVKGGEEDEARRY